MQNDASTHAWGDASVRSQLHTRSPLRRKEHVTRGSLDEVGRIPGYVRIAGPGRRKRPHSTHHRSRPYADNEHNMVWHGIAQKTTRESGGSIDEGWGRLRRPLLGYLLSPRFVVDPTKTS